MNNEQKPVVKTAVIGVGHLGQHHARIMASIKDVEVVCIVDEDKARADEIAEKNKLKAVYTIDDIPEEVEAVSIVTPTSSHHAITLKMLESGRDVLVEKPICLTVEQAEQMVNLADATDRILQVGHIERFNPAIISIKEQLDRPLFIESHRLSSPTPRVKDVGVVLDLMIHDIDLVCSLVGSPVEKMEAIGVNVLTDREDIANARLTFESGCIANLTASRVSQEGMRKIRLFQKDAYFSLNFMERNTQVFRKITDSESGKTSIVHEEAPLLEHDALGMELSSFIHCVRSRKKPIVGGEEGLLALQLALDITDYIQQHLSRMSL